MANWSIDIEEELRRESLKHRKHQEGLVSDVYTILNTEAESEVEILETLSSGNCNIENIDLEKLDAENIYTQADIQKICIRYRLRFLDTKFFKGKIPYEAIQKIKSLQKKCDIKVNSFKIIAPSSLFKLEDINDKDPVLFLNLGNGFYYFIHKWGSDLSWHRRLLVWPAKSPLNTIITIASTLALLVYFLPESWFINPAGVEDISSFRMFLFFYLFIATCGLTLLFALTFHKNFNENEWNSQYFN